MIVVYRYIYHCRVQAIILSMCFLMRMKCHYSAFCVPPAAVFRFFQAHRCGKPLVTFFTQLRGLGTIRSSAENRKLSWCQLCRQWWRRRLSLRQPPVPPMTTKLASCRFSVFSVSCYIKNILIDFLFKFHRNVLQGINLLGQGWIRDWSFLYHLGYIMTWYRQSFMLSVYVRLTIWSRDGITEPTPHVRYFPRRIYASLGLDFMEVSFDIFCLVSSAWRKDSHRILYHGFQWRLNSPGQSASV